MKGDVMKPYYSIEELAKILNDDIYNVADGLCASRIAATCGSKPADFSRWARPVHADVGGEIIVTTGVYPVPNPSSVIVATENLPQFWKDSISSYEEHKNLPTPIDNDAQSVFDKASETYPPELDIALRAWRKVSATEGKGKPKARIKAWLDTNEKNLSGEAKERIAIVANWDKTGGATRSD